MSPRHRIYRGSIEIWIDPTKRTKNDRNRIRFADSRPEGHPTENPRDPWIYIDSIKRRQREMETNKIKIGKVWGAQGTGEDAHTMIPRFQQFQQVLPYQLFLGFY
jgi:hypothetical protein